MTSRRRFRCPPGTTRVGKRTDRRGRGDPLRAALPPPGAVRVGRGRARRQRARPHPHRRRAGRPRRGAAAAVHLRRDAGVDRRGDQGLVRPAPAGDAARRDRGARAASPASPATTAPAGPWTSRSGICSAQLAGVRVLDAARRLCRSGAGRAHGELRHAGGHGRRRRRRPRRVRRAGVQGEGRPRPGARHRSRRGGPRRAARRAAVRRRQPRVDAGPRRCTPGTPSGWGSASGDPGPSRSRTCAAGGCSRSAGTSRWPGTRAACRSPTCAVRSPRARSARSA